MEVNNPTLHDGTRGAVGRVLGIAGTKTIHVKTYLDFIQTVIDAIEKVGPPPAQHHFTVGPADRVLAALKQCAEMSFHREANAPGLVRCRNVYTVAGTERESRQCRCRCRRFFLQLYLLRLELGQLLLQCL